MIEYRAALYSSYPDGIECLEYRPTPAEAMAAAQSWAHECQPLLFVSEPEGLHPKAWGAIDGIGQFFLVEEVDR
jgi:hypothetical protein